MTPSPERIGSGDPVAVAPYRVELPDFEGPLDLLLHLIRTHEIDIFNIPIAFITEKYLEYLALMKSLQLDVAGEYLLMAATLAHIKSKMLLPVPPTEEEVPEEEGDPREELVKRLLEYQKFKNAAEELLGRDLLDRDVFVRPESAPDAEADAAGNEPVLRSVSLFALLEAFKRVLDRVQSGAGHEITVDRISVAERIAQIVDRLRLRSDALFDELFDTLETVTRFDVIVTFLALLEMARLRMVRLAQSGTSEPIHILLAAPAAPDTGEPR